MNHRKERLEVRGSKDHNVIGELLKRKTRNWWMQLRRCALGVIIIESVPGKLTYLLSISVHIALSVSQRGFGLAGQLGPPPTVDVARHDWG
jgi:hypothetical protein